MNSMMYKFRQLQLVRSVYVHIHSGRRRVMPPGRFTSRCLTDRSDSLTPTTRKLLTELHHESPWIRRRALAQAVTLVESRSEPHQEQAGLLLSELLQTHDAGKSFRIGIAGPPGAGKSTFIEALGDYVLQLEASTQSSSPLWIPKRLAVLCIDPSSAVTGGSILGDKTRMMQLSKHPRAFVRPTAASGTLGGLAPHTDDVMRLVAAADYEAVLLETVGLGQSEIEVKQSVDLLVLLVPPAGGDDLQGVKKGIVEVADMLVVTKADGSLLPAARHTAADYRAALRIGRGSDRPVLLSSAVTGEGLEAVWKKVSEARKRAMDTGTLKALRQEQGRYWMWRHVQNRVLAEAQKDPELKQAADALLSQLDAGQLPPRVAAYQLWDCLVQSRSKPSQ